MKKFLITSVVLLIINLSLLSCAMFPTHPSESSIYTIEASGPMALNIIDGSKKNKVVMMNLKSIKSSSVTFTQGTLHLKGTQQSARMTVYTKNLENLVLNNVSNVTVKSKSQSHFNLYEENTARLRLIGNIRFNRIIFSGNKNKYIKGNKEVTVNFLKNKGSGTVTMTNFHGKKLTVENVASGNVILRGFIDSQSIFQTGRGKIDIRWVNDNILTSVAATQGVVKLAGKTKKLEVNASGTGLIDAYYLRANNAYVKSYGNSVVKVNPINQLFANAQEGSHIYYRGNAKRIYKNTSPTGLVIHDVR